MKKIQPQNKYRDRFRPFVLVISHSLGHHKHGFFIKIEILSFTERACEATTGVLFTRKQLALSINRVVQKVKIQLLRFSMCGSHRNG